ncbi:hypothetical protein SAMN04490244_110103 [Tranquillimonas rosea]|uniref:DUF2065 domain-containing protein n=1 Tax=Tranquillimonas rosea TaxID=641238 RepID=A0A1H9WDU1_9RHOB|nr:DUF2065 domain-containing protein [Tranquillimonas rosea]SES32080.1 hypothetical protein SAMN04490244_110103 [Tranquillimonas rosea]
MTAIVVMAIGLAFCFEGLVFALAPFRIEQALEALRDLGPEARRIIGLAVLAAGVALVALGRALGA